MTQLRLTALTLLALLAFSAVLAMGAPRARAEGQRVLLLHGGARGEALADALRVELAANGTEVLVAPAPTGETSLLRAGAAQAVARQAAAAFAIWVETQPTSGAGDLLRVVDPESDHVRDAPLPVSVAAVAPRTFAAVAASLIGELLEPSLTPLGPVHVHVRIETPNGELEVDAAVNTGLESAAPLGPPHASVPVVVEVPGTTGPVMEPAPVEVEAHAGGALMPRTGFTFSASLLTAFIATGAELSVGLHLNPFLRLDLFGQGVVTYINDPSPAGTVGLGLTRVGASSSGRFDVGGFVSLLVVDTVRTVDAIRSGGDSGVVSFVEHTAALGFVAGGHFGWMWERSASLALGFRLAGGISLVTEDPNVVPFGLLSFRTEMSL